MGRFHWSIAPAGVTPTQRQNFLNVQIDAMGIGLASAATPFLPVFPARLGASHVEVGLLTAMPAITGFLLAVVIGHFLQHRRNIVPWFSGARLLTNLAYALTGLAPFLLPRDAIVPAVLLIWAVVTIPQTVVNISFSVVMNAVAGPERRYELMSRRWSILGFTTAVTVAIMGQILDRLNFPFNYQVVFLALSLGGLISYYYSSHIQLPDTEPVSPQPDLSRSQRLRGFVRLIRGQPAFVSFIAKQFVYTTGTALALPLFPLYYVHDVQASDTWIGLITTSQTAIVLVGYYLWVRQSKQHGGRFVLLCATFGLALHPALTALTHRVGWIAFYAGLAGIDGR